MRRRSEQPGAPVGQSGDRPDGRRAAATQNAGEILAVFVEFIQMAVAAEKAWQPGPASRMSCRA